MILRGAPPMVRKQLLFFGVAAVAGMMFLSLTFLRVPEYLGVNRNTVEVELAQGAGVYEGAEVTYLGLPIGTVADLRVQDDHVVAELRVKADVGVPAGVVANVHSRSAVGEQYVDLVPRDGHDSGQLLADGDRIPLRRSTTPVEIGPVLDSVDALVGSLDAKELDVVIREGGDGFRGRAGDLQKILDTSIELIDVADANFEPTARLLQQTGPLLETVNSRSAEIRRLSSNLSQLTRELRRGDRDLRRLLIDGPRFSTEAAALLEDLDAALPGLLQPADVVASLLAAYNPHIQQLLSDLPMATAMVQAVTAPHAGTNDIPLVLSSVGSPPECTDGYPTPDRWTSPLDTSPQPFWLVYCKAPRDSASGVRGARNVPCALDPARRTGDVRDC